MSDVNSDVLAQTDGFKVNEVKDMTSGYQKEYFTRFTHNVLRL